MKRLILAVPIVILALVIAIAPVLGQTGWTEFGTSVRFHQPVVAESTLIVDGASTFTGGNGGDWVNVDGATVTENTTWNRLDAPYRFEDSTTTIEGDTLTIRLDAAGDTEFSAGPGKRASFGLGKPAAPR